MEIFFQAAALVLLAVILSLTLTGQARSTGGLLVMGAIALVLIPGLKLLRDLLEFLQSLTKLSGLEPQMVEILIKCTGIALVCEIANLICADSGNSSLGKALQILAACVILWLSLPVFQQLMTMVQKILEAV